MELNETTLAALASAAAGAYSLGLNPMPAIRRLSDAGQLPRVHYFAGHMPAEAMEGDYALQINRSNGRLQVEIVRLEAGGPDGLVGGDTVAATDWIDII